jgi:hypothetical protein
MRKALHVHKKWNNRDRKTGTGEARHM